MSMVLVVNYMKRLKYILQHSPLIKVLTVITLCLTIVITKTIHINSVYTDETVFVGTIYKIKDSDNKLTIYIKAKEKLVIEYYYQEKLNYHLGDTIKVTGVLIVPNNNTIPNQFNYRKYLYNHGIHYIVKANEITKVANNTNVIYYLKDLIQTRINKISNGNEYLQIFLLGNTTYLKEEVIASYRANGLSHIFSISGMHISFLAMMILYTLKKFSYSNYYNYLIVIIILTVYSLLVSFTPSVARSLIMYILFTINKLFNLKIKSIDIMCLVLLVMLIINPFYLYDISFEYSYIVSFVIILYSNKTKKINNKVLKSLYVSLIIFLTTIPICTYYFYQINYLTIILNLFYIPLVSFIILPLSFLTFIIPKLSHLLILFINIMEHISLTIAHCQIGIITLSKPSILLIIIYYFFAYLFLIKNKYQYLILLIIIHKNINYFDFQTTFTFIDVNQGDSILIKYPHNQNNILIDTGGNPNSNYSLVKNKIIPYLKSIGISKLDYLILTHGDYDHMGEAINLVENFKVEKVIFNCGEINDLEQDLIKVLNKKNIPYYTCITTINDFYFLQTKIYNNENDNSNVVFTETNGYKFLLMGDAGVDKEQDILEKYNISNIDVLKVGHHGSRTSSSKNFINKIKPKYSVISVGKNNRYGHPNKEVLNTLGNSKVYRTDKDGSITFKIKNNNFQIATCEP